MVKGNVISEQVRIKAEAMEIGDIPWGKIIERHTRYWVSVTGGDITFMNTESHLDMGKRVKQIYRV